MASKRKFAADLGLLLEAVSAGYRHGIDHHYFWSTLAHDPDFWPLLVRAYTQHLASRFSVGLNIPKPCDTDDPRCSKGISNQTRELNVSQNSVIKGQSGLLQFRLSQVLNSSDGNVKGAESIKRLLLKRAEQKDATGIGWQHHDALLDFFGRVGGGSLGHGGGIRPLRILFPGTIYEENGNEMILSLRWDEELEKWYSCEHRMYYPITPMDFFLVRA